MPHRTYQKVIHQLIGVGCELAMPYILLLSMCHVMSGLHGIARRELDGGLAVQYLIT